LHASKSIIRVIKSRRMRLVDI